MYTKRIQLINYGPVEKLDIEFPFESETPKPVVLVGATGSFRWTPSSGQR